MPRKLLFFGNGIGMSLDPTHFSLETALASVWNNEEAISREHKRLIHLCIPGEERDEPPRGEPELDLVQIALVSCEILDGLSRGEEMSWLTQEGREFPSAIRRFVHNVACHFHLFDGVLDEGFSDSIAGFVRETRSHIATTNHDNLVYQAMIQREILRGFDGPLVDGITTRRGFQRENLERRFGRDFGWYMHLHGSLLFYTHRDGRIKKLHQYELVPNAGIDSKHLVLTHVRHKRMIIDHSQILTVYWEHFGEALKESEEIIVVGYGGEDTHLNERVRLTDKPVRVIERAAAGPLEERQEFWLPRLGTEEVIQVDSVLDFREW